MTKADLRNFDPVQVARLDAAMWQAYYNHQFLRMFVLLLRTMRSQLQLNWWLTIRLSFYSAWAATDYRLHNGHENFGRVQKNLTKFYKVISDHCTEPFNYKKVARLELRWWNVHRYPEKYPESLAQCLAEAAAAMYGIDSTKLKVSAEYRAEAMLIPDHKGDRQTVPPDYPKITELLIKSWRGLHKAVQNT